MKKADREGHVRVFMREGNGSYLLERHHYEPLRLAWMAGQAFYTGSGPYGEPVTIKLALVEGVADNSAAMCREAIEDDEEDRRARALTGDG